MPFDGEAYRAFFQRLTGRTPYDYQVRIAAELFSHCNVVLRAPTDAGKTWSVLAPFLTLPASFVDDLRRYVEALGRHFGERLVSVVLFGSRARGEARSESDIDMLIVVRGLPRNRFERYGGLRDVARRCRMSSPQPWRRFCSRPRRRSM